MIGIITDQHFGLRKGSQVFHDYMEKFYNDIFFPTLKENKIKTLLDLGDTFDNRKQMRKCRLPILYPGRKNLQD